MVSRCFPGGYNVKLYISRGRLAWWLLAFLCCGSVHFCGVYQTMSVYVLLVLVMIRFEMLKSPCESEIIYMSEKTMYFYFPQGQSKIMQFQFWSK